MELLLRAPATAMPQCDKSEHALRTAATWLERLRGATAVDTARWCAAAKRRKDIAQVRTDAHTHTYAGERGQVGLNMVCVCWGGGRGEGTRTARTL